MIIGLLSTFAGLGVCIYVIVKHKFTEPVFQMGELNIRTIGHALMGTEKYQYLLPFEVISLLLLACIVGGIMIARKR